MGCMCHKIGKSMARRKKRGGITITTEDVLFAAAGGVLGLAVNPLVNKALANQSESVRGTAGKFLPALKVAGGGYVGINSNMDRKVRMMGLGLAAEGGIELGLKFLPSNLVSISGVNGDVFSMLGNTTVEIPITPRASASLPTGGAGFEQEQILGTDVYEEMQMPLL